ncbi:MAG TPA: hypothetical protein VGX25_19225 [Actinophytocola sp.]|uniref:amino acid kinase family protein n=1 Tax=Actinophytocola sp. TaxID=1872138 RepID=UPI002DDD3742|nr:hypothetical protein [Actinophytocola sp.]HEV2781520.1 hypothetical protein [Actinophytocola sp.]
MPPCYLQHRRVYTNHLNPDTNYDFAGALGRQVVAVVSATGSTTDELIRRAHRVSATPAARELDLLMATGELASAALMAMAVRELGVPASALPGWQAGIHTHGPYGVARARAVRPDQLLQRLCRPEVVVVAGCQGVDRDGDVTTLGRGGSDATAVLLAAALGAPHCEIYTDVDGVCVADPRVVPGARRLAVVSYPDLIRIAEAGAAVMQLRAARMARDFGVPLHVRSSFHDEGGTWVRARPARKPTGPCCASRTGGWNPWAPARHRSPCSTAGRPDPSWMSRYGWR